MAKIGVEGAPLDCAARRLPPRVRSGRSALPILSSFAPLQAALLLPKVERPYRSALMLTDCKAA